MKKIIISLWFHLRSYLACLGQMKLWRKQVFLRPKEVSAGCKNSRLRLWRPFLILNNFLSHWNFFFCLSAAEWRNGLMTLLLKSYFFQFCRLKDIFELMQCWISGLMNVLGFVLPNRQDTKSKTILQFCRMSGYFQFQCKREPAVALLSVIKWLGDRKASQLFPLGGEMSENQCKPNALTRWLGWWDRGWGDPP